MVLHSFADAVDVDYDGSLDGDDSVVQHDQSTLLARVPPPPRFLMSSATAETVVVPYPAGVGEGDSGSDAVYAIKRAYARRRGNGRLTLLEAKPLAVRRAWQRSFSQEFGASTYSKAAHVTLAPWFDDRALYLLRRANVATVRDAIMAKQIGWLNAVYNRRQLVAYSQERPSQLVSAARLTRADCSGSAAGSCAWAGILPHVDWRYTNTRVQIGLGSVVGRVAEALPGDVFLYGTSVSSPTHEAVYLGDGLVWSFGSFPVKILPHAYRHDRVAVRRFVPLV